jgi:hypothetical protein
MKKIFQKALEMNSRGMSVIPVGKDKIPLINWKEFQERLPEVEEIEGWWEKYPEANVGVVTGKVSGITVVDVENGGDISRFPKTFTVKTGGGGWHLYYKYYPFQNKTRIFPLTDVRGDGGYVVAPPSVHQSGNLYEIIEKKPMVDFPHELFGQKTPSSWKDKTINSIDVGSRNSDFTSVIGGLLTRLPQHDWDSVAWSLIEAKNKVQKSPLSEHELKSIFESVAKRETTKRNTGGELKDIKTDIYEDQVLVRVSLANAIVCFKAKNIIGSLMEATVITWIEKTSGLSHEMPFYLKIKSDSNKEQMVRILSKAFDKKDDKEVYPWTILVTKAVMEIEKIIREHVQDFSASTAVAKNVSWVYEPFIQEDQINTFFGMGSSGKTLLSIYLSTLVAKNEINSMLIDYENDIYSWVDKVRKIIGGEDQKYYTYYDSEQIPLADQIDKIREVVKKRNIKLVIVDSASMASGDSTSDESSALRLMSALKLLKTTVVLIAHQRKNDGDRSPIGSIQYENQARNVWNFTSTPDDFENHIIHIACKHTKANNTYLRKDPIGFKVSFNLDSIGIENESAIENFKEKFTFKQQITKILTDNPKGLDYKEIADILGLTSKRTSSHLAEGRARGLFDNAGGLWVVSGGQKLDKSSSRPQSFFRGGEKGFSGEKEAEMDF